MAKYKSFFTETELTENYPETGKIKSTIKDAIDAEFDTDFNDKKKDPSFPELGKAKKMEAYKSSFSEEEGHQLDKPKDEEKQKLLGSVHPEVIDPSEVKFDQVEISYGYTHDDFPVRKGPSNETGHDATDIKYDGRLDEELVDDTHSTVKRAIGADFNDTDFNKKKKEPELKEPEKKKKSKKNEDYTPYKSAFNE